MKLDCPYFTEGVRTFVLIANGQLLQKFSVKGEFM